MQLKFIDSQYQLLICLQRPVPGELLKGLGNTILQVLSGYQRRVLETLSYACIFLCKSHQLHISLS